MNLHIVQEQLLELEQQMNSIKHTVHLIRLELTELQHSKDSIKSSTETVEEADDQNRRTARR